MYSLSGVLKCPRTGLGITSVGRSHVQKHTLALGGFSCHELLVNGIQKVRGSNPLSSTIRNSVLDAKKNPGRTPGFLPSGVARADLKLVKRA